MSDDISKRAATRYWDLRKQRQVTAPTLAELLLELNDRLRADPAYRLGTRFVLRRNALGEELPTWEGPAEARPLIHRVLQLVTQRTPLPMPFQIDGIASGSVRVGD